eukprot:2039130-Karenia_brevis.AAC.1
MGMTPRLHRPYWSLTPIWTMLSCPMFGVGTSTGTPNSLKTKDLGWALIPSRHQQVLNPHAAMGG